MNLRERQQAETRRAILSAVAEVLAADGVFGFSMQKVADHAGVTHRTVYNYFPTRESLNDAFAVYVEEELGKLGPAPDEGTVELKMLPGIAGTFGEVIAGHESKIRAYAMLMVASRAPAEVMRARSARFEKLLEQQAGPFPPKTARLVTAALRMFVSSVGWHVLTELHGLSPEQTAGASEWAVRVLVEAVERGDLPETRRRKRKR